MQTYQHKNLLKLLDFIRDLKSYPHFPQRLLLIILLKIIYNIYINNWYILITEQNCAKVKF